MRRRGFCAPHVTVVLLPQHPVVNETLGKEIMEHDAQAVSAVKNMPSVTPGADDVGNATGALAMNFL